MNQLEISRKEINRIDAEMARLFEQRMKCCEIVAEYKKENALSIRDKEREALIIKKNKELIEDITIESYYGEFLQKTIDLSCKYQARLMSGMKVGYSGVKGAYAYIAARKMFPEAELISYPDFSDAYKAVENGEVDSAVLPIENSYAGEVGPVMDLMFSGSLYINQVVDLDIIHNLIGVKGGSMAEVKKVVSHPQALSQCEKYIKAHGLEHEEMSNTAAAAKYVLEKNDKTIAAIASDETADIYNLELLDSQINDSRNNTTRFAAFSRTQNRPVISNKRENESFIIVFTVKHEAGALAQTLNIIGAHNFNMKSLRSRPMKDLLWNYFFFVELEGNVNTTNGRDMMQELSAVCAQLKLVGTYYAGINA